MAGITPNEKDYDRLDVYPSKRMLNSGFRWRYVAAGNQSRMANGGQHYNDFVDCLTGALRVCGATMVDMDGFPMKPPTNFDQVFYLTRLTDDTNPLMLRLVALPAWSTHKGNR